MTEVKILVHNINDVVHRAAFEKEVNVYLKMGWNLRDTHQAVSPETGFLMMTAVLEKEAEEAGGSKEKAVTSEQSTGKEPAENSKQEKEEISEQEAEKESSEEKKKEPEAKEPVTEALKGFKIKEKKEDKESAGSNEQKEGDENKEIAQAPGEDKKE